MSKRDFIRKITSRKFWLALASFVAMLIIYFTGDNSKAESVSALIMAGASVLGYLLAEGLTDHAGVLPAEIIVDNAITVDDSDENEA